MDVSCQWEEEACPDVRTCLSVQGDAGRLIYEFLWDEYADWYIEASKTRMQDPQAAQGTALPFLATE